MKKVFAILSAIILTVLLTIPVNAETAAWYQVSFTGADIWTYSADNALAAPTGQLAPRRYRDWTQEPVIQATTYGVSGGTASTAPNLGFGAWAPTSGFAFDSINLWGAGGAGAAAWGEKYVSVGNADPGAEGVSSWQLIAAPSSWSSGIVKGNDPWSADATHAFPVWRSGGLNDMLGIANMNDPDFLFTFNVLIFNPLTAFDTDGKLRVYFGGYRDDLQGAGPGNYEVSGIMRLDATAVPLPGTVVLLGSGLAGLAFYRKRRAIAGKG